MSGLRNSISLSPVIMPFLLLGMMALSALACSITGGTPTEAAPEPTQVSQPTQVQEEVATHAVEQPEATPTADLSTEITGFWKTKIVSKQVIIFEFQSGGHTVWHYQYNNGQKKDNNGTYSVQGDKIVVNFGEPQELTAQLDGEKLTLTGPDGKPLEMHRISSVDDPGPNASKNIAQDIINRWQDMAVQEWIEFKADGTVAITSSGNDLSGTYSVSGNNLLMKLNNQEKSSAFRVEIDGNMLTLFAEDGSFTDYVK